MVNGNTPIAYHFSDVRVYTCYVYNMHSHPGIVAADIHANSGGHEVLGEPTVRAQRSGVPQLSGRHEPESEDR